MITYKGKDFKYSHGLDRVEGECLSTDTKPTEGIANGSCLIEMDTGDRFMFDEANGEWLNITNPGGGGGAEVWLVGNEYGDQGGERIFPLSNAGATDYMTELFTNSDNYQVFLNGEELPYKMSMSDHGTESIIWTDGETEEAMTKGVNVSSTSGTMVAMANYLDASTAPTSVEVSVKAK